MRRDQAPDPVLITSAHESADDEYDRRRKKYAIMMLLRALCVIGAALTYRVSVWFVLAFGVACIALPWCAVIIANDRPAKKRAATVGHYADLHTERALPSGDDDRTIDG